MDTVRVQVFGCIHGHSLPLEGKDSLALVWSGFDSLLQHGYTFFGMVNRHGLVDMVWMT